MNKFKVGDIITGIKPESDDKYHITTSSAKMEVTEITNSEEIVVKVLESPYSSDIGEEFDVESRYFELIENIKFNEIKSGDIITLRNGDRLYVDKDFDLVDLGDCNTGVFNLHTCFDNNFKSIHHNKNEDIIKVERVSKFNVVYEEIEKRIKEMTLKEVCKELGYEIKIIKEKEGNK